MTRKLLAGFLFGLLLFGFAFPAAAQVSLELKLSRSVYMQYEAVFAKVKMRNYSGQPLVFGKDDKLHGELLFDVTQGTDGVVPAIQGKQYMLEGTILMPGETKELIVPLSAFFPLGRLGAYRVHAYVKHAQLKDMFRSNECRFEVNPGVVVWSRKVGIPEMLRVSEKIDNTIKDRTYSLRMLVENATKYYYLVIEDGKTIYSVIRIGREIGMERYKVEVDMLSRLHILMPISPKIFRYIVVNINGKPEIDRYMKTTKTIPSLVYDAATGQVIVTGGAEALPGIDYDAPITSPEGKSNNNASGTVAPAGSPGR